jgi:hypothetical protein
MIDYTSNYRMLMRETLGGVKIRAIFFGYGSETLRKYLEIQKDKIHTLQHEAFDAGFNLNYKEDLDLSYKLLKVDVKILEARLG